MKAYAILEENIETGATKLSAKAFKTIDGAQKFCDSKSNFAIMHNPWLFYDGFYRYEIKEIEII